MRAFLMYIDDWLSSGRIAKMDAHEERGYLRLLLAQATDPTCTLPDDDDQLAIISLLGAQWRKPTKDKNFRIGSRTSGEKLRECFKVFCEDATRIFNERLRVEWVRQQEYHENKREGGRAAAKKRWQSDSRPIADPLAEGYQADANARSVCGSGYGSSSDLNSKPEEKTVSRAQEPEQPTPQEKPIEPEVIAPPPSTNGNVLKFGLPALERQTDFPETTRAVHDYFPECDLGFVRRLANAAGHAYSCVAEPQCQFSDPLVAEAVRRVYKPNQEGAGLFTRTVPECIRTWATEGVRSRASPMAPMSRTDRAIEMVKRDYAAKSAKGVG